jgi:hypothetical protein
LSRVMNPDPGCSASADLATPLGSRRFGKGLRGIPSADARTVALPLRRTEGRRADGARFFKPGLNEERRPLPRSAAV